MPRPAQARRLQRLLRLPTGGAAVRGPLALALVLTALSAPAAGQNPVVIATSAAAKPAAPPPASLGLPRLLRVQHVDPSPREPPGPGGEGAPGVLPPPRRAPFADEPAAEGGRRPIASTPGQEPKEDPERNLLLSAARNAASRGDWETAVARFEEFFRRFGDDPAVRREYAGILVQAGQTRRAIRQYEQLLQRDPTNGVLRTLLGDIYLLAKDYRAAVRQYQEALRILPNNAEVAARLARAYFFDGDVSRALEVYDRYLARLRPDDERVPRALGALLLDLGRPRDALGFLEALRRKEPDNAEVLALLVRAHARLGDKQQAYDALRDLADKAPRAVGVRLELGEALYASGDLEVARRAFQQVLDIDPKNGNALVGLARVQLQWFQPDEARRILKGFTPNEVVQRIYRLTRAEYHQAVGEYVEAGQVYQEFLRAGPNDYEVRLALGEMFAFVREYEKAKAEFAKVPPTSALGRAARLGFADALAGQWRLHEAVDATRKLAAEVPSDGRATAQLVRILGKGKQYDEAVAVARSYLDAQQRNEPGSLSVRVALARVLLDARQFAEAAAEYEALLDRPGGRLADSFYGLAMASAALGRQDRARAKTVAALTLSESDARNRILLADLHYRDNDDAPAIDLLRGVLATDPLNLSALIRLADAQLRVARFDAKIGPVLETCETILRLSPTNIRGQLAKARARANVQDFKGAVVEYNRLIAVSPHFLIAPREKARVLFSDHEFGASAAAYQEALAPHADELLWKDLSAYLAREPRARALLEDRCHPDTPGRILCGEVARAVTRSADDDVRAALVQLLADHDARSVEQTGVSLESEAKSKKDWRNYEAVPVYEALIAVEPGNEEGLFDLGQVFGGLRQTLNALPQFSRTLEVEPQHRESMIALERASLELQPRLHSRLDFFHQDGRDGLARVDRTKYGTSLIWPFGDENEWVEIGFFRAAYDPDDDRELDGNILVGRVQKKGCAGRLFFFAQGNVEQYEDRIRDRVTYDTGVAYDVSDLLRLRAGSFLDNVVENGESMRQDIHRVGLNVGADLRLTRWWNVGGTYRFAYYSDVNRLNEMQLYSDCSLTLPPKQLKLVGTVNYQSFTEQTLFLDPTRRSVVGATHPYFSPAGFTYYEGRVEWYHWLSRDYFTYSNQCWYSLQYGLGWDDDFNLYQDLRALLYMDVKPWFTVGGYAQGLLSRVYDSAGAGAFAIIRFPCRCNFARPIGCHPGL